MAQTTKLRTGRHCVFQMHVHLVFVTKYRKKIFTKATLACANACFDSVCNDFGASLKEMNGEADHVHLLIEYPPKVAISKLVNSLKGVSSRILRKKFPDFQKFYWQRMLWSPSYFAASCGGSHLRLLSSISNLKQHPANVLYCATYIPAINDGVLRRV